MISAARFPIFMFKRIEILQIQAYGQKQKSSEEPQQLKTARSPEAFRRYQFLCETQSRVWQQHLHQDKQCHIQSKSGKEVKRTE